MITGDYDGHVCLWNITNNYQVKPHVVRIHVLTQTLINGSYIMHKYVQMKFLQYYINPAMTKTERMIGSSLQEMIQKSDVLLERTQNNCTL